MRFGCCLSMVAPAEDKIGRMYLPVLAKLGYDYVELPLANIMELTEAEFDGLKGEVAEAGIQCEVCNNFFPGTLHLTGGEVDDAVVKGYVRSALNRAAELGAKRVVFGSGAARMVPEGFSMDAAKAQIIELLKFISAEAEKYDITIVIESVRKQECNIINTFEEGVEIAKIVHADNVKMAVDYYHMMQEDESLEHLMEDGGAWISHVHLARSTDRFFPVIEDAEECRAFFDKLREAGYDQRVSVEAFSNNAAEELKSIEWYRSL